MRVRLISEHHTHTHTAIRSLFAESFRKFSTVYVYFVVNTFDRTWTMSHCLMISPFHIASLFVLTLRSGATPTVYVSPRAIDCYLFCVQNSLHTIPFPVTSVWPKWIRREVKHTSSCVYSLWTNDKCHKHTHNAIDWSIDVVTWNPNRANDNIAVFMWIWK